MTRHIIKPLTFALAFVGSTQLMAQDVPTQASFGLGQPSNIAQIPSGQLRDTLSRLPAPAQARALRWLQDIDFPVTDVAYMHVDPEGGVFYVDRADTDLIEPPAESGSSAVTATDPGEVFYLHSRPGAANVVYLDFNGHTISGTAWNNSTGVASHKAKAFDLDGDPSTFNQEEMNRIAETWHRIAEDFAAYDIDVTTEEPANFDPRVGRLLFTTDIDNNGFQMPAYGAGGVAYVGVWGLSNYASAYSPALVYYNRLGGGYAPYMAAAGSHELGHNLSLSHDGTSSVGYYNGHGSGYSSWAPIMGSGYYSQVTQWSNGNYADANNSQDDIRLLTGHLSLRDDDHGNQPATATLLEVDGNGSVSVSNPQSDAHNALSANKGVIETRNDVDVFVFNAGQGNVSINVQPAWQAFYNNGLRGANLDIKLRLLDNAGNIVASNDPLDETQASISASVMEGSYYLAVSGVGNASISYDDYGSQGMYFISGSIPVTSTPVNRSPTALDDSLHVTQDGSASVAVLGNDSDPDGDSLTIIGVGGALHGGVSIIGDSIVYTPHSGFTGSDSFNYHVSDGELSATATVNVQVQAAALNAPLGFAVAISTDGSTAQLSWQVVSGADSYEVERSNLHKNGSRYVGQTLIATSGNNLDDAAGKGTYSYRIRAVRGAELGPWSNSIDGVELIDAAGGSKGGGGKGGRGKK